MSLPIQAKASADPVRIVSGEAETNADLVKTPTGGGLHKVNPDAYTQAGKSAAAKRIVGAPKVVRVQQTVGASPLLDAATAFARVGFDTRLITLANANELCTQLDSARSPYEVRLVHMLIERTLDHALIGATARQRLSGSVNQAFSRTKTSLDPDRGGVDSIGLRRGDQSFVDKLIELLSAPRLNVLSVTKAVREISSPEALKVGWDAVAKIFPTLKSDAPPILASFLSKQGLLRTEVVKVPGAGRGLQIQPKERLVTDFEAKAIRSELKAVNDTDTLRLMSDQLKAVVRPPLFGKDEARVLLAETAQRLMMQNALGI